MSSGRPGDPSTHPLTRRVRSAVGDAWQAQGRLRAGLGGGAMELPGIRLMSSGIALPQWNSGDVTDAELVDVDHVRSWFAERAVPWGLRVPSGTAWPHGRLLFTQRCMAAADEAGPDPVHVDRLELAPAGAADLDHFATVDAAAFQADVGPMREWVRPMLGADGYLPVLARLGGEPVAVAYGVRTSGEGGESVGVFGVGVLPAVRRRGVGGALTAYVVAWGRSTGADLAWLNPDTEAAARLYARMGFEETGPLDIHADH